MDKKTIQTNFGKNVRKHRTKTGKNQEEIAFMADMSAAYLSELERGEKCPTIDIVCKISKALDVSVSELLDFAAEEQADSEALFIINNSLKTVPDKHKIKLARIFESLIEIYHIEISEIGEDSEK